MMTLAEHEERRESLYRTSRAISAVAMDAFNKQCALHEYSWNDKLPAVIRESAQAAGEKYWEQYGELSKLSMAVYEVTYAINARPFLYPCDDGTYITCKGMLPNGVETSTDEEEALKMYAAYKSTKASEVTGNEEAPF